MNVQVLTDPFGRLLWASSTLPGSTHDTTHAKIRCLGERAMATLKGWRLLWRLRCSTNHIAPVVKTVVLHRASA